MSQFRQALEAPLAAIELLHGDWRVQLCAGLGGALTGVWWRGRAVLRDCGREALAEHNVRRSACYPLVPYSNRIGYGAFDWEGRQHRLRLNFADEPHAIHGFGWQRAWRVALLEAAYAVLVLDHSPDADWPFACSVTQRIALRDDGLHLELTLVNRDSRAAPGGLGWHPYFPLTPQTRLQTGWNAVLVTGDDRLPRTTEPVPDRWRFDAPRSLENLGVDHCFTGWRGEATIFEADYRLRVMAEGTPAAVLFRPPGEAFFALEPVSHSNDALHFDKPSDTVPMRTLAPGETMTCKLRLEALMAEHGE
ncbi:aldose 1-epimerase [Cupriavidus sp. TMH.W2]|uniref:aldose 1-epimerase n=1 Tax=Cupriavidus sp. TMH.W2 TaxID=3434465 RepID=UPI003D7778C8